MLRIERYGPSYAAVWNDFVGRAKNSVFLFHRGFMDYHADRFADHSLLLTVRRVNSALPGVIYNPRHAHFLAAYHRT